VFWLELKEGNGFDQVLGCDQDPCEKQYIVDNAAPEPPETIGMEIEEEKSLPAAGAPAVAEDVIEEDSFVVSKLEYLSTASGLSVLMWSVVRYAG
jgi:hypothetical protein